MSRVVSGRKYMSIAFTTTYCLAIIGSAVLAIMDKIGTDTFMALLSGFGAMVMFIVKSYFDKDKQNGDTDVKTIKE